MIRAPLRILTPVLLITLLAAGNVHAADLRPFVAGSADQIRRVHAGQTYVLALWSLGCPPCHEELAMLGALAHDDPAMRLVLVSTDTPDDRAALLATLNRHGLGEVENWVFADAFTERLRFEIDRRWQGELPRSYLLGRDGTVQAISGRLTRATLEHWIAAQQGGR